MAEYPVEYRESPLKARARALLNILAGNTSINSRGLRDVTGKQPGDLSGSRGRITQPSPVTAKTVAAPYDVPLAPPKSESRYERAAEPSPAKPAGTRAASAQSVLDAINKASPGPEYDKLFDREHDRVARLGNNFRNAPLGDNARNALNALTQGWRGAAEIHDIPLMTPEQRRAAVMQINTPGLPADVRLNDARIAAMRAETNDLARRGNLPHYGSTPIVSDAKKMALGLAGGPVQYGFPDRDVVTPGMMRVADADALLKRIDAGGSAAGPANVNPVSALRGAPGSMTNAMRAMQALGGASAPATQGRQLNPEPNPGMDYQKWRDLKSASLADTGKRAEFDNRTISPARPKARFGGAFKEDPKKQEQYLESRKEIAAERRGKVQDQRERAAAQREFEGGNPELMLDRLGGQQAANGNPGNNPLLFGMLFGPEAMRNQQAVNLQQQQLQHQAANDQMLNFLKMMALRQSGGENPFETPEQRANKENPIKGPAQKGIVSPELHDLLEAELSQHDLPGYDAGRQGRWSGISNALNGPNPKLRRAVRKHVMPLIARHTGFAEDSPEAEKLFDQFFNNWQQFKRPEPALQAG